MKRGVAILMMWLVIVVIVNFLVPHDIPASPAEGWFHFIARIAFPFAAWVYAGHSGRVTPVVCYGLIAGAVTILPVFGMPNGDIAPLTPRFVCLVVGVPALMALICVGLFLL